MTIICCQRTCCSK